jgi:CHAT domain-containing protein
MPGGNAGENKNWPMTRITKPTSKHPSGAGVKRIRTTGNATRTILVSMWPVETTSARELTTRLFSYQQKDKELSRARALRKSMLDLIDGPGLNDNATGKIVASYAHPLFWAPFIIVGESRQ